MRRARPAVALALAVVLMAGCGGDGDGGGGSVDTDEMPVSEFRDAAAGLCVARDQAGADVKAARATFYDRSHDALHTIARFLDPVDRAAAGRLLEAKQRVEAGLDASPPPAGLAADLGRLAEMTRAGLAELSVEVPACR